MGVSKIIVVDIMEKRLQKALELGADYVINGKDEDAVERIMELTDGKGFDLGIETAGSQITASQLIKAAKKGSAIVFVGYPMAIEAVSKGQIKVKDIVTNYFELDDIQNALDTCVKDKANVVKGVIKIGDL